MSKTIKDIAAALGARAFGAVDLCVDGLAEPASAAQNDLALAMSPRFAVALSRGRAKAAVVWDGADWQALGLEAAIVVPRPRVAMAGLTALMQPRASQTGISPQAVIDPTANIGDNVCIGPFAIVGAHVAIGKGSRIAGHVSIGDTVEIGENCFLHPGVVIGADGFSFVTAEPSNVEIGRKTLGKKPFTAPADPTQYRIHSLGGVWIGDDVEIGANSTVDAGTIRATRVGHGTKIDNLVQVGHNVTIGNHCLLCAQTAIAGSAQIGDRVILGGKSGVGDNLVVGSDTVVGGAAIVLSDVPEGSFMMGYPAQPMLKYRAHQRRLRQSTIRNQTVSKPE